TSSSSSSCCCFSLVEWTSSSSSTAKPDKCFSLWYLGWSSLDRRTTLPMLPWLVAEIRRRGERTEPGPAQARPVQLSLSPPVIRCVPANSSNTSVFIFEHKAQFISRFIHNSHDLSYFAYLIRSQPEDPESEMACHVFKAGEPNQVPEVISSIRQASKAALKEDSKPKQEGEEPFYNSQKFEVLYCGKVMVAHKKAPSTLIDDCIDKFRQHEVERKRQRLLNGQRGSSETVEFIVGDDPLSSSLIEEAEAEAGDQAKVSNGKLGSSPSVGSLRGAFPECILEDSGFEEQQEFRTRCNSLAGGMQSRSVQAGAKGPTRRRHASAPNNVQPSDADKNRTMLFQVGRFEVNLISPDSKTVVLEKNFKDISSCSQGLKQTDHFGFICREAVESGSSQYLCYVFQCASESLVDEVMLTLKQAFSTAAALQSSKTQVKLCEACPMHSLHKLCERIEGLYPPRAKLAIQKHLSLLSDNEQADIFERVQRLKPSSDQEENELVILHLRQLSFLFIYLSSISPLSLTSSLENIFSRGASRMRMRLGSMGSFDRQDDSPGDSPPGTPPGYLEEDPDAPQFRRRAHTFSHPPIKKRISFTDAPTQAKAPLRRQHSVAPELLQSSNGEGRKRTLSGCSSDSLVVVTPRRVSWRQKIFLRVASPMNKAAASTLLPLSPRALDPRQDALAGLLPSEQSTGGETGCRTPADYRALWKKAIHQQILLIRMEKENQRLEASRDELHIRKMKLDYQEVGECPKEVQALWERKLNVPCRTKVQWDKEEIHTPLCQGVPKGRRGEVWLLLSQQYRLRHRLPQRQQAPDTPYQDLLKQLTAQQHSILVDLGRTFPTHQYFSTQLGAGQLSLYNLLKAYSLLDTEVGYCQGISFVAGILLLHMSEEQAFDTLKFLMYDLGLRRQYRPDMISLQVRALHYIINIYRHYALFVMFMHFFFACFLIVFVFCGTDLLFVQGTDVIFKVALCLLSSHEGEILECDSFECIVDYLKTTIPTLSQNQMEETITKALEMDISKQLHAYEVEYHVLQDEMMDAPQTLSEDSDRLDKLEKTNAQLKKQNMELLEKLQAARVKIQSLETSVESFLARESQMKHLIRSLEQEKTSYQKTIERMRSSLPQDSAAEVEMTQLKSGSNGKTKAASKKP
uniref:TBC1 domain family, member 4 n=1 Tax=Astyanax mexicanus TaxID=7994 RepID=A0A8B9HTB5_ASTMX